MKKLFSIVLFLVLVLDARSATIIGDMRPVLGDDATNTPITLSSPDLPQNYNGKTYLAVTIAAQLTNGQLNVTLDPPGRWNISFFGKNTSLRVINPANTNTYDISQMLTNVLVFVNQGISKYVQPGSGVLYVTNNAGLANESVVISSTAAGGTATNAYQSQASGSGLTISTNLSTFVYTLALNSALQSWSAIDPTGWSNGFYAVLGAFDTNGAASTVQTFANAVSNSLPDLVYHSFVNGTYLWPTNWVSDSGHQMYIIADSLAPLVVSNNVLGAPTGTLFSVGNDFAYVSCSNEPPFDVMGMNIETDDVQGGNTSHAWQCYFLVSPTNIFPQSGLNLTHTNNFLHVGVVLGDAANVGFLFATNFLDGPYSYGGTIPDALNASAGRGSRHNVELRRLKSDSASVVVDGITCLEIVNTNLSRWWGTNLIWEFQAAFAPEDHDSTRTRLASVYTRRLGHYTPETLLPGLQTNFNRSLTLALPFTVPITTPTTNSIGLNGFFIQLAYPTNNLFNAPGYTVGSFVTTTNGDGSISAGNNAWKHIVTTDALTNASDLTVGGTNNLASRKEVVQIATALGTGGSGTVTSIDVAMNGHTSSGAITGAGVDTLTRTGTESFLGFGIDNAGFLNVSNQGAFRGLISTNGFTNLSGTLFNGGNGTNVGTLGVHGNQINDGNISAAGTIGATTIQATGEFQADAGTITSTSDGSGTLTAIHFSGGADSLFNVQASQLIGGPIPLGVFPSSVTTNNNTLTGMVKGNGARGVTNAMAGIDYIAPAAVLTNSVYQTNVLVDTSALSPASNATNYILALQPGPGPGLVTIFGANTNLNLSLTGTNNADWGRTLFVNNYTSSVNCNLTFTFTGATNQNYTAVVSNGWAAYYNFHTPDATGTNVSVFNSPMLHH